MQMPNRQAPVGELASDLVQAIDSIAITNSVTTQNNQFYQANSVVTGGNRGQDVALASRQGTVTIVLGRRTDSGITSRGRFGVFERTAFGVGRQQTESSFGPFVSDTTAGSLEHRVVNAQRQARQQSDTTPNSSVVQNQEVIFESEVNVGELDTLTCGAPPADVVVQPEDC